MKTLIILLLILVSSWIFSFTANASLCHYINNQSICILKIKRSAKNYWEYRASVSINNIVRPIEVYDCRQRLRIQKDGIVVSFKSDQAGKVICHLLDKK